MSMLGEACSKPLKKQLFWTYNYCRIHKSYHTYSGGIHTLLQQGLP